jgi:hypothetical protein
MLIPLPGCFRRLLTIVATVLKASSIVRDVGAVPYGSLGRNMTLLDHQKNLIQNKSFGVLEMVIQKILLRILLLQEEEYVMHDYVMKC